MDYENLLMLLKKRRSIRNYKQDPVPIEDVMKVLEAARWAPSGHNCQPWEFVVVRDREKLRQVTGIFLEQAKRLREKSLNFPKSTKDYLKIVSTFIIVCADSRFKSAYPQSEASEQLAAMYRDNSERIHIQSISAAICNILLAACALGLGTVWFSGPGESITQQQLREVLNIPEQLETICCIPLGYPQSGRLASRCPRPLETMVHFDEFDMSKWRSDQDVERLVGHNPIWARFYRTGRMP